LVTISRFAKRENSVAGAERPPGQAYSGDIDLQDAVARYQSREHTQHSLSPEVEKGAISPVKRKWKSEKASRLEALGQRPEF
jgi:hypothetical protein